MMTDDRIALARADRARMILEDELVKAALSDMKALVREEWEKSPVRDVDGREHLYKLMRVIGQFEGCLQKHLETGQLVAADIRAEEERKSMMAKIKERIRA